MTPGYEITGYAVAPGFAAIVEWKQGVGGRLLQWFAGGAKLNPVLTVADATATPGQVDGAAFSFTAFAYYSRKDATVHAWVREANNKWIDMGAVEVAKG